jgi:hypothetical protein
MKARRVVVSVTLVLGIVLAPFAAENSRKPFFRVYVRPATSKARASSLQRSALRAAPERGRSAGG